MVAVMRLCWITLALVAASWPAQADIWTGSFTSQSGILWAYKVQTAGTKVSVTVQGTRDRSTFQATCVDAILDTSQSFEAKCQHKGNGLRFTVKARLDGDTAPLSYVTESGDRAAVQLLRATAPSIPSTTSNEVATTAPPSRPTAQPGDLQLPSCRNVRYLSNYTRYWFANRSDPVLGVPPTGWNESVLARVAQWADRCLASEVPANQAASFKDYWQNFRTEALAGIAQLKQKTEQQTARQQEIEAIRAEMTKAVPLSKGGAVSCASLGSDNPSSDLDAVLFGQKIRDYSDNDFTALRDLLAQCDTLVAEKRRSGRVEIIYAPNRYFFQNVESFVSRKRAEEAEAQERERLERELQDPEKRAQYEAKTKERRFDAQEAQIRGGLEGRATRQPTNSPSDQVIFCGGYFSVYRAIDALVQADITPSADDSAMRALGFQTLAQTWMGNRQGVLGEAAVIRDLMPIFAAGLIAGLSADVSGTKSVYRRCVTAAEALARERANLK